VIELLPVGGDEDLATWVDVHNRVSPTPVTTEEVAGYRDVLDAELHLLALEDGQAVGSAFAVLEPDARSRGAAEAWIGVLEASRRHGVGSALYAALSRWSQKAGLEHLEGRIPAEGPGAAWAERRGFAEVGRETRLALDLEALELPPATPHEGVEILTWAERPELARGIYEVAREAYPDVPGYDDQEAPSFEEWLRFDMSGPNDRPEAVFVALAGDEVVGYSKLHLSDARPLVAANDMTGVKRAWRGRGIAGALKRAQLAWAKDGGYVRLETANETRNAPIQRLNERLGYRPFSEWVRLRGPLAADP
jgi:GNAT superfamily N-acetyltransferase